MVFVIVLANYSVPSSFPRDDTQLPCTSHPSWGGGGGAYPCPTLALAFGTLFNK